MRVQLAAVFALALSVLLAASGCSGAEEAPAATAARKPKIVFVTGDEEYRSEESMPMLAAILQRDLACDCRVAYALGEDGAVDPNRLDHIDGLGELADADLMVLFTRFRRLPDEELALVRDFAASGRPMVGFRTATHAFRYPAESPNVAMNDDWPVAIFGQKWITHHGHFADGEETMTEVTLRADAVEHPVLSGVRPFKAYSWLYHVEGGGDALPQGTLRLLDGHARRSSHEAKPERFPRTNPVAWVRTIATAGGEARVFFTTLGHPYDFKDENMRRLALNGILWALGREAEIPAGGARADLVGDYDPPNSGFGQVYRKGNFPRRDIAPR